MIFIYIIIGFLAILGLINILANLIPQLDTLKGRLITPLAKKWAFKKLSKQATKADIKGGVNTAILKLASEFPTGWLKPIDIEWVTNESREDFLNENEIVIRMRPVESQELNFVTAVYYFVRKSFFPRTKKVVPERYFEASVLFASRKIIERQRPELKTTFEDSVLDPEIDRDSKVLDILQRYETIDKQGLFNGIFLREIHTVASEAKLTPMRNKMRQEINDILKHIEDFLGYYNEGVKQEKCSNSIPANMWTRIGPITNYGFLLIASPMKISGGVSIYVNRAKERAASGIDRLYVLGTEKEKKFANQIINAISNQVPEYTLKETLVLSHDYRGDIGGIGAVFIKKDNNTVVK